MSSLSRTAMTAPMRAIRMIRPRRDFLRLPRSCSDACRSDSAALRRSFWTFLSSRIAFAGPLPLAMRAYASRADSTASRMLSRSSSSSMSRWTYGFERRLDAASPAFFADCAARLLFTAINPLLIGFLVRLVSAGSLYPISAGARPPAHSEFSHGLGVFERYREGLAQLLDVDELEIAPLVLGDLVDLALVERGHDH